MSNEGDKLDFIISRIIIIIIIIVRKRFLQQHKNNKRKRERQESTNLNLGNTKERKFHSDA